jgi:hypothetical protein
MDYTPAAAAAVATAAASKAWQSPSTHLLSKHWRLELFPILALRCLSDRSSWKLLDCEFAIVACLVLHAGGLAAATAAVTVLPRTSPWRRKGSQMGPKTNLNNFE